MNTQRMWPYSDNTRDDGSIVINQRMIHHLLGRQGTPDHRGMMALGIEVRELRDTAGLGLAELAVLSGVDRGFIAILEDGQALMSEVTDEVLTALATGLSGHAPGDTIARVRSDLETAMTV